MLLGLAACQAPQETPAPVPQQEEPQMPLAFLEGSYEAIGRSPDSKDLYSGTVTMALSDAEPETLSVTRTIGEVSVQGEGTFAETRSDGVSVLRVAFEEDGQNMEITYLIQSDLDNYARLTGYVYEKEGETQLPGLEVLFNDHYRAQ